jgi:hypothetical protein
VHIRSSILPRIRGEGAYGLLLRVIDYDYTNQCKNHFHLVMRTFAPRQSAGQSRNRCMAGEIFQVSSPQRKDKRPLGECRLGDFFLPRHAGSRIPMVIALGNVIRMCMSDDAFVWVPHRQNAAPKERKFCSTLPGCATQQRS